MAIITELQEGGKEAAAKPAGGSDEDVLAAVLARKGGPLPFLQASIDVVRKRSDLFLRDSAAPGKLAAMAKAARFQAEADERQARVQEEDAARELMEKRRNEDSRRAADAATKGEAESAEEDGWRGRDPNDGNGLDLDKYSWTQELSEVNITVPVPQGTKSMLVVCEIKKNHLKVSLKGQTSIIDGELYRPIKVNDCFWTIEDGKSLSILLAKQHQKEWWTSVIRGGPELDTRKVKISPSASCDVNLDGEDRQKMNKAMYDYNRMQMGRPTSNDTQTQELLKKFPQRDSSRGKPV